MRDVHQEIKLSYIDILIDILIRYVNNPCIFYQ
jgi:hypothetical protein